MKRVRLVVMGALAIFLAVSAAVAQPKDPFLPPVGSAPDAPPVVDGGPDPGERPPADPVAPGDGLARTGQDVGSPFAAGTLMLASGLALLLLERALRERRRGAAVSAGSRNRRAAGPRSHTLEKHTFVI